MFARGWQFRLLAGIVCGLALGWASPGLTTIQDTLYKADGTPFTGFALIQWTSFTAADSSNIATHNVTVPIINGILHVQLVPNASGTSYDVRYNSDGKIQFEETWVVAASTAPLQLRDVRVATAQQGGITPPPNATHVQESDVVGLVDDLALRPVRGASYAASRAAAIDAMGMLAAVAGSLNDCVRVDGTAGPCGGTGPAFADGETPAGSISGSNAIFTLADPPTPPGSLTLYRNGLLQNAGTDYSVSGNVITFASGSIPQPGDSLTASYRLIDSSYPVGQAGGALVGSYPNPDLGEEVILDSNVASYAGIQESKLALTFPTHTSENDPTAAQKAAMDGAAPSPSGTNPFVTNQDPRLTDARTPLGHNLLSSAHADTAAAAPSRGDLIVGQGASPVWTRVPLGPANRCLMSNGSDAVWNTCLYTAFTVGSIPFVDANGNLAQNNSRLVWDNGTRRLSVGNSSALTTLYVWDSLASTGSTGLIVRAGQGQGTDALARWLDFSGSELARVGADGRVAAPAFRAATSASQAAWQDAGSATDPSGRIDGDSWFNSGSQARKTAEGGQVHTTPQVICSSNGGATSSTALTSLGSCTIPAGFLKPGDRIDIRFDYSHEGATTGFAFEVHWAGTTLASRSATAAETAVSGKADAGIHGSGAQWNAQSWGAVLALAASTGAAGDTMASPISVSFLGQMSGATSETVTLRNFTVVRYPAQQNP